MGMQILINIGWFCAEWVVWMGMFVATGFLREDGWINIRLALKRGGLILLPTVFILSLFLTLVSWRINPLK
ncbi:MAG: hypothetical protein A2931_01690 [Candidatus Niyogibacteria bacterium RIFCSPLOWO2_01_FULL_45_48]|uniref:Uncharacterized protein n=2 Tax=Candidatus Niyogiibacteriota TaxID=1817912 RepID=A0A1G2EYC6_9BACT|nr:MAG: hypothetical protein A2931_01690 [Candidatus Niyogibacteria bacterium RIFCSPLOWO2_01_FULL_45_48]